jgi:NAD(P)-dependent dehydrogenase (short-subunit alcohol dehydrogenase family)
VKTKETSMSDPGDGRLIGKVAVITGGASGIGEATAKRFVAEGARVVVADVQDALGQAVADGLGSSALYVHCDVTKEEQVAAAVDLAVATWGTLDVMFNNAGIVGAVGPIADTTADAWQKTIDVLLNSVFYGTKHAARIMIPQGSGSIIATTSIAGVIGGLGPHAYSAAKTAIVGLTKSVASELNQYTIRVNAIAPGTIPTALTAQALGGDRDNLAAIAEHARRTNGMGIASDPMDIANAALYLASDEARLVNGHTLVVDAGRSINGGSARFASAAPTMVDATVTDQT